MISQSAVSIAIKTLEKEFSAVLIKRREPNYGDLELTEAGKQVYLTAKEILVLKEKLYDNIASLMQEGEQLEQKTVSITTNAAIGVHLLPQLMEKYKLNLNKLGLKIIIETDNYSSMVNLVKNKTCDIGIIPVDVNIPSTNSVFTFEQRMSIVAKDNFTITSYQDFQKIPLVFLPKTFLIRKVLDSIFQKKGVHPNIVMELNYPSAIIELIKVENFVSILHSVTVKEEINRGEIVEITPAFKLPLLSYKLVVNQDSVKHKHVHEVIDFLSVLKNNNIA